MNHDEKLKAPPPMQPEQQGDGQPENQRDVEDDRTKNPNAAEPRYRPAEEGPGTGENPESGERP